MCLLCVAVLVSADVCGDLLPTQEGSAVSVHSSFTLSEDKGSSCEHMGRKQSCVTLSPGLPIQEENAIMRTAPSERCLTRSPISSDVKGKLRYTGLSGCLSCYIC